jgi:hypothetical protein
MRKIAVTIAVLGTSILAALYAAPAQAQTRTWVSGVGDDVNPCSRTAPCKTFAGAISKTANGGEIDCLDPGGFGQVTITKSITIDCRYNSNGGELHSGGIGINVVAGPGDRVVLIGLDFEGAGVTLGTTGLQVTSALEVIVYDCLFRNTSGNAINVTNSVANSRVVVKKVSIANAAGGGVNVQGSGGVANTVSLIDVLLENTGPYSIQVNGSVNTVALTNVITSSQLSILNSGNVVSFGPSNVIAGANNPTATVLWK